MEKYLKKNNLSGSRGSSEGHVTFDLSGWADSLSRSQRNRQAEHSAKQARENPEISSSSRAEEKDEEGDVSFANPSSSAVPPSDQLLAAKSSSCKKSSIPRPRASLSSSTKPVALGRSSPLRASADKMTACDNAASTRTSRFSGKTALQNDVELGDVDLKTTNTSSSEHDESSSRTSPHGSKQQSGLLGLKASSPSSQRLRSVGQELPDRPGDFPQKKASGNISCVPFSLQSVEKPAGSSCQNYQPPQNSPSGE